MSSGQVPGAARCCCWTDNGATLMSRQAGRWPRQNPTQQCQLLFTIAVRKKLYQPVTRSEQKQLT